MLCPRLVARPLLAAIGVVALTCGSAATTRAQDAVSADSAAAAAARQLDVGEQWYRSACAECHAAKALDNADFRHKWNGRSAYDLFSLIRTTMPDSRPGSLTQGTYVAIVAYLIKVNGMPAGVRRLTSDSTALSAMRLSFPVSPRSSPR
jgi:cytochrome c5